MFYVLMQCYVLRYVIFDVVLRNENIFEVLRLLQSTVLFSLGQRYVLFRRRRCQPQSFRFHRSKRILQDQRTAQVTFACIAWLYYLQQCSYYVLQSTYVDLFIHTSLCLQAIVFPASSRYLKQEFTLTLPPGKRVTDLQVLN